MQTITKFIAENKNYFSTVFAFILWFWEPLNAYLTQQPFELKTFLLMFFGGIVSYSVGKYPKGLINSNCITPANGNKIDDKGYANSEDLKDNCN